MNRATVAQSSISDSFKAGTAIGDQIRSELDRQPPDVVIVSAAAQHDYQRVLRAISESCQPGLLVGCSSAGEFSSTARGVGEVCAMAIRASGMQFTASLAAGMTQDRAAAARQLVQPFRGMTSHRYAYRTAMVLTDALAGHADDLLEHVNRLTGGTYQFFGGGAGDDSRFQRTHVFLGTEIYEDAAVALEVLSDEPIGIGVSHGWKPSSEPMRVTESDGMVLRSLNSMPVLEVLQDQAYATGQNLDLNDPLPFFLHNIIGIEVAGGFKLRVPLKLDDEGGLHCAAEVPTGATVYLMSVGESASIDAAASATQSALAQIGPDSPRTVMFFDCAATRLRMGQEFGLELDAITDVLKGSRYLGCNTYGQIARADGQLSGFHNCTAVACAFPF
jgi:hypothetical protein